MSWLYLYLCQPDLAARSHLLKPDLSYAIQDDQRVIQFNPSAQTCGLQVQMRLATAFHLQPELQLFEQDSELRLSHQQQLAQGLLQFSPHVATHQEQGFFINAQGMQNIYSDVREQQLAVFEFCTQQGFDFSLAASATPLAARWQARQQARINKQTQVNTALPHQELRLEFCDLDASHCRKLAAMGIYTLEQYQQLPQPELRKRLNQAALDYMRQVLGQLSTPLTFVRLKLSFVRKFELLHEISYAQGLIYPLSQAFDELQQWLISAQLQCSHVRIDLNTREQGAQHLDLRSAQAQQASKTWQQLLSLKLNNFRLNQAIINFQVTALQISPVGQQAQDLFGAQQQSPDLDLLDRLQSRLGQNAVVQLGINDEHRPESAGVLRTYGQQSAKAPLPYFRRPLWLLPNITPLNIKDYRLLSEVERIACAWWDTPNVQRDYYMAQHRHHYALAWVFQELSAPKRWFLHGWFA